jgi:hypothetical protein
MHVEARSETSRDGGSTPPASILRFGWSDLKTGSISSNCLTLYEPAIKRASGFEPPTSSLGSWHSTTELRPQLLVYPEVINIGLLGNVAKNRPKYESYQVPGGKPKRNVLPDNSKKSETTSHHSLGRLRAILADHSK